VNGQRDGRLTWRDGVSVELADGYTLTDGNGVPASGVTEAAIAVEGGFVHIAQSDCALVQIVSAPAVRRITYRALSAPVAEKLSGSW
jgi:hypothetical protein